MIKSSGEAQYSRRLGSPFPCNRKLGPDRGRRCQVLKISSDGTYRREHVFRLRANNVVPKPIAAVRIDCGDPPLGCVFFHFGQWIVSFRFQNEMRFRRGVQLDNEVGNVIVHLAVVKVWNGETQPGVLHKSGCCRVVVDVVGGRLLPLPCVRDDVVQVTADHFTNLFARPEVNVGSRAGATVRFVPWNLGRFALGRIRANGFDKALYHPPVIWR